MFQARHNTAAKHPIWREDKQIWRSVNGKEQIYFHSIIQKETASSRKTYLQQKWDYRSQRKGKKTVITYEKTVKDPLQPFRFETTARYARYQWG